MRAKNSVCGLIKTAFEQTNDFIFHEKYVWITNRDNKLISNTRGVSCVYRVEYKNVQEIIDHYLIIGELSRSEVFCECILIENNTPTAIVLNTDIPLCFEYQRPLKNLIRCYIIEKNYNIDFASISEIIDRYR